MGKLRKYLIIGDGKSPHLLKWAGELVKHVDLYIFSFNPIDERFYNILDSKKLFSANRILNPKGGNVSILRSLSVLSKFVHYINPYIVNPHYITSNGFIAVLLKKLYKMDYKIVSSCWGSDILVTPEKNFLYKMITKYILKNSDLATSDSEFMTKKIKELANVDVITFPFGVEKIPEVGEKEPMLFFSNRMLKKNYNIDKVIRFFGKIYDKDKTARLVIANDGYMKEELVKLVDSLNLQEAVSFVGYLDTDRQNEHYSRATFFVTIPDSDSTSVSLLEAMSFGCIPICSNIPANNEWVKDGLNGFFIDDALDKILTLSKEKKEEMARLNRLIIEEKALWHKNIETFVRVIYEL